MNTTLHACSVPGCGAVLRPHLLMCRTHWRRVPEPLQAEVWSAWERFRCGELSVTDLRDVQGRATAAVVAKGGVS